MPEHIHQTRADRIHSTRLRSGAFQHQANSLLVINTFAYNIWHAVFLPVAEQLDSAFRKTAQALAPALQLARLKTAVEFANSLCKTHAPVCRPPNSRRQAVTKLVCQTSAEAAASQRQAGGCTGVLASCNVQLDGFIYSAVVAAAPLQLRILLIVAKAALDLAVCTLKCVIVLTRQLGPAT